MLVNDLLTRVSNHLEILITKILQLNPLYLIYNGDFPLLKLLQSRKKFNITSLNKCKQRLCACFDSQF